MVLETLGLREPARVCVTSLSQMCSSAGPSPIPIPIELLCPGMDISHEERGQEAPQKEGALPRISSSVFHRLAYSRELEPACPFLLLQEADGESFGGRRGRGSWPPWPQLLGCCSCLFFPVADPLGASRSRAMEAWLPGCLAQGPGSPLRPLPTPWDTGLRSGQVLPQ